MTRPIRILGIDPGLRRTGWGMVEIDGNRLGFLGCGSVATDDRADLAGKHRAASQYRIVIREQRDDTARFRLYLVE